MITVVILFLSTVRPLPFYIDVGDYETPRSLLMVFPVVLGMHWWQEYKNFKLGLDGESYVTNFLKSLLDEYYLINGAKSSKIYGDIDHIILGPNGIFVIETKNYTGIITVMTMIGQENQAAK